MEDKITLDGRYAIRADVDEQGQLLPGRSPVQVLSVTLGEPSVVCYQAGDHIYRVRADGSCLAGELSHRDLVPVAVWVNRCWSHVDDVPFGAAFSRLDSPVRVRLLPTEVGSVFVVLGGELQSYQDLFEKYAWTTDGKTWHRCWKQALSVVSPVVQAHDEFADRF